MDGVRVLPDRRPRFRLWIGGRPKSQRSRKRAQYVATVQVEIIYATRGVVLDVDNTPKRILDALKGIVYVNDAPSRAVKSVGLRLDQGFRARGSPEVYKRLLSGKEFLVNVADANTPATEKPSLVTLVIGQPAAASPAT